VVGVWFLWSSATLNVNALSVFSISRISSVGDTARELLLMCLGNCSFQLRTMLERFARETRIGYELKPTESTVLTLDRKNVL
jgi:hypothetical protein